jgi:hypothetical protein
VPVRDIGEYHAWVEREAPSIPSQEVARHFLDEVGDESWRYPSIPIAALSAQPDSEVRQAELPVAGEDHPIHIWYRHFYATDDIDVIAITNR